ncbi:MAG: nucleotidyltransferase domain-containing protein [Nanoarchaeota archaeon]
MGRPCENLKAFALAFASFLIQNLPPEQARRVSMIILFGSVARGDSKTGSDVDIFIATDSNRVKRLAEQEKERFYESEVYRRYWRLIGVKNEIKPICGRLEEWPDLRKSIINDGIVLYGKYTAPLDKENPHILMWWQPIKNQSKRVLLSKQLQGYSLKGRTHDGLAKRTKGCQKMGGNTLLVPIEHFNQFKELFERHGIQYRQKMVSMVE